MKPHLNPQHLASLRSVLGDVMTSNEMMAHLHHLCDVVGARPAGSVAEARARDYLHAQFERFGLTNVLDEPFDAPHWTRGSTVARVVAPVEREIELLALPLNRSHQLKAAVVSASFRTMTEFDQVAPRLKGKVCINYGEAVTGAGAEVLHRGERVRLAHSAGAAAFLWVSNWPGGVLPTGSMDPDIAKEMPAFGISLEDAGLLERLIDRQGGATLEIATRNDLAIGTSWNVSADLATGGPEAPIVVVTAHYDSHDVTTGAHDNAAGCAVVLECARVLSEHYRHAGCSFRFVIFSAEEVGLVGSKHYAYHHAAELRRIRFLLNADGLGVLPSRKYIHIPFHVEAARYLSATFARYGFDVDVDNALNLNWDHAPFAVRGVPVGSITAKWPPGTRVSFGHTKSDTLDKIDPQDMRYIACCSSLVAFHLAVDDTSLPRVGCDAIERELAARGKAHMMTGLMGG
jgi:aminopeptidase YwaD